MKVSTGAQIVAVLRAALRSGRNVGIASAAVEGDPDGVARLVVLVDGAPTVMTVSTFPVSEARAELERLRLHLSGALGAEFEERILQ